MEAAGAAQVHPHFKQSDISLGLPEGKPVMPHPGGTAGDIVLGVYGGTMILMPQEGGLVIKGERVTANNEVRERFRHWYRFTSSDLKGAKLPELRFTAGAVGPRQIDGTQMPGGDMIFNRNIPGVEDGREMLRFRWDGSVLIDGKPIAQAYERHAIYQAFRAWLGLPRG